MKLNGRVLTYPLGFTEIDDIAPEMSNAIQEFDVDGNPETDNEEKLTFDEFIERLNELLRSKADLEDTTDDGENNPTVVLRQGLQWLDV